MMNLVRRLALWFALVQWFAHVICGKVQITCPRIPGPPHSSPNALSFQSNAHSLSLNESCFGIDIALNVENILPDPSYIAPATNMEIIGNALQNRLRDHNSYRFDIKPVHKDTKWSTVNQCPHKADETVDKLYFETVSYEIKCNENTLKVATEYMECQFQTPPSIAYQFTLQSAYALLRMRGDSISVAASIFNTTDNALLTQSNAQSIANLNANHEFVFPDIALSHDTVYLLNISIVTGTNAVFEFEKKMMEPLPVSMSTIAAPHACVLGPNIAVGMDMKWALLALCNPNNAKKRSFFENYIYQKHSSQTFIPYELPDPMYGHRRLRIRRPTEALAGSIGGHGGSLYKLCSAGHVTQLANDTVAPSYDQCIAIDPDTWRIFSVGGHENGAAISRLDVHQIDAMDPDQAHFIRSLSLDRARSGAMCHYWKNKRDNEQYIIVINGMETAFDPKEDHWFNDIVFIPLNRKNMVSFPPIRLAHNVIDMK
eukprot:463926_1